MTKEVKTRYGLMQFYFTLFASVAIAWQKGKAKLLNVRLFVNYVKRGLFDTVVSADHPGYVARLAGRQEA